MIRRSVQRLSVLSKDADIALLTLQIECYGTSRSTDKHCAKTLSVGQLTPFVIKRAVAAVSSIGGTPSIRAANGGLDANWMVRHGVSTVTFGAGQNEPHTIDEWINLDEYDRACVLAVQLATMRGAHR